MTREEAKEILTHNWTRVDNPNYSESELDEAIDIAIEALQAEPKHGKWIEGELYIKCSECGYPVGHLTDNYCPNCGAKMDKGEQE